jgi:hypothetical protein
VRPERSPAVRSTTRAPFCSRATSSGPFDAILLDVDNGPQAFTLARNRRLYSPAGLARIAAALAPGGVLAVWSAGPDAAFITRLEQAGFAARAATARGRDGGRGNRHTIFLAVGR